MDINHKDPHGANKAAFFVILAVCAIAPAIMYASTFSWFTETLFESGQSEYDPYFKDDFSGYEDNSEPLDAAPEALGRWKTKGAITAWADIEDWRTVDRVDLKLTDADGKTAVLTGIENLKIPREQNKVKSNDAFPDHAFACDQGQKTWEDFLLVDGRNLLFWEYDRDLGIDMEHVVAWQALDGGTDVAVEDVVVHDGLCATENSLDGVWHSPNGLPQYGVWWPQDGQLVMRNVEQEQYPSNGDHVRILSMDKTPKDFLLRTKFKVTRVDEDDVENAYIRLAWDFDDVFDPGHDETIVYGTFKYGYFGLQRVYPVQRYFTQGFEPASSDHEGKTRFMFKEGRTYELDVRMQGQDAVAEVYELKGEGFRRVAKAAYTFEKERPHARWPFAMETTGNVEILLDDFEVKAGK